MQVLRSLACTLSPKLLITHKAITISLAFLSTNTLPSQHQQLHDREVTIADPTYWTKKIHKLCTIDRNVEEALRLLDRLRLHGYRPDSLNLSSIIHALCDSNQFSEAHHRILLFITSNCVPDERTCNVIIARLLDARTPYCTLHVIRCLINVKPEFVPSLINYNRLMNQLCLLSRPNEAHRLFFDMKSRGHCPNTVSYTTLINGFCKIGNVSSAQKVLDEMCENGVMPNSLTYSIVIRGVLMKRDVERGRELICKLWEKMKDEEDWSLNNAAFANLIESLCREGFLQEVFRIAEDFPQGKSVREDFAYGQLIDSLCKVGRHHGASRIVYIMRNRGFVPSVVSYNCIIHGLCLEGGCLRAYQLLEEGIGFGFLPSEYTYKVLVEGLCKELDIDKAREVLKLMLSNNDVDRTRICNIYLRALCLVNNLTELLNVLVFMLQNQCQPDVITLNTGYQWVLQDGENG
ncbi:Pentatricopeptide repeat-containing protein [Quillaja saponaria]|uniref:Pentatricopeptide repeat-containing protein n=1 Tax=Quillaja saponaria TaxID=32244 RepID=A0AAD7Q5I9_QUISA|nr:Pentatricopeptide repeat-containing protein [Quillaja saponaria]